MNELICGLAAQIKNEHRRVKEAGQRFIEHAMRCGDLLLEAKSKVNHGQWLPWLEKECDISERMAQRYMRAARHRLEIEAKTEAVSDLTLSGALEIIQEPPPPPMVSMTDPKERRLRLMRDARVRAREIAERCGWGWHVDMEPKMKIDERGAWVSVWFKVYHPYVAPTAPIGGWPDGIDEIIKRLPVPPPELCVRGGPLNPK